VLTRRRVCGPVEWVGQLWNNIRTTR